MPDINLTPYTSQLEAIQQRKKMAELLSQQALQPIDMPQVAGARVSPYAGLAKMLQAYSGRKMREGAQAEQKTLADQYRTDTSADFSSLLRGLTPTAAVPEGPSTFTPNVSEMDMAQNPRMVMQPETDYEGGIIEAGQPGAGYFGVTPGTPAIPASGGRLTPEGFAAMKTPAGQQQYMAQLLAQNKPREPKWELKEIKTADGGVKTMLLDMNAPNPMSTATEQGRQGAKSNFGSINPSQYTPESIKLFAASGGTDFSLLKTPTPINKESKTGDIQIYDKYVAQQLELGKKPLGIDQFLLNQKIASRNPAPVRERFVYDAARGGRVNLDTGELLPVTQGGQPIGGKDRGLSSGEVDKITAIDVLAGTQKRLAETFQDKYAGYPLKSAGELANVMGAKFGGDKEAQAQWWASHEANDNVARNALFGASLTAGEQKAWEKTSINPGMSSSMIKARMTERQALIDAKRDTTVGNLEKAGFNVGGFKEKSDAFKTPAAKVTTRQEIQDVATQTGKSIDQVTKDAIAKGYKVQ
jgi:hypothetical protein